MPTLVRFLTTLIVLSATFAAVLFYLANFVEPRTRDMTVRIPAERLEPRPASGPALSGPEAGAGAIPARSP